MSYMLSWYKCPAAGKSAVASPEPTTPDPKRRAIVKPDSTAANQEAGAIPVDSSPFSDTPRGLAETLHEIGVDDMHPLQTMAAANADATASAEAAEEAETIPDEAIPIGKSLEEMRREERKAAWGRFIRTFSPGTGTR